MWDALPAELQAAIVALVYDPDASGYVRPSLLRHVPSQQFAHSAAALKRRSGCYRRARALAFTPTLGRDPVAFVDSMTRLAIDHVLLRRPGGFPSDLYVALIGRVRRLVDQLYAQGRILSLWSALGLRRSAFHRSVAAEVLHAEYLEDEDEVRVVAFLHGAFNYLHSYKNIYPKGDYGPVPVVKEVLNRRLGAIESERFADEHCQEVHATRVGI